jgi:hypothetical protein
MKMTRPTRLDYCQYLLVSQINYTITNYSDPTPKQMSHDAINRDLHTQTGSGLAIKHTLD